MSDLLERLLREAEEGKTRKIRRKLPAPEVPVGEEVKPYRLLSSSANQAVVQLTPWVCRYCQARIYGEADTCPSCKRRQTAE